MTLWRTVSVRGSERFRKERVEMGPEVFQGFWVKSRFFEDRSDFSLLMLVITAMRGEMVHGP